MNIATQYNLGEEVFLLYKDDETGVKVKTGHIKEILYNGSVHYYVDEDYESFPEEYVFALHQEDIMLNKIKSMLGVE